MEKAILGLDHRRHRHQRRVLINAPCTISGLFPTPAQESKEFILETKCLSLLSPILPDILELVLEIPGLYQCR